MLLGKYLAADAFFAFLMVQFMRNLPRELDEAACIDDCGPPRIRSWHDFVGPLLYRNECDRYTVPLGLKMFIDQDSAADYGGMVALLPVLRFFLAFQRHLGAEGMTPPPPPSRWAANGRRGVRGEVPSVARSATGIPAR